MLTTDLPHDAEISNSRPKPSDIAEIMRLASDALSACSDYAWFHRERAVARGLILGDGCRLLKSAARRAERLADSLQIMLATGQDLTPKDWRKWAHRDFAKVYRSRRRVLNAAERDFWKSGTDRDAPEFHQLAEIEHMRGMFDAVHSIAFISDAIRFTLKNELPQGYGSTERWLTQVTTEVAGLFLTLRQLRR
jgi:hypothetical protein